MADTMRERAKKYFSTSEPPDAELEDILTGFAQAEVEREREACAQALENYSGPFFGRDETGWWDVCAKLATAIRARGKDNG